MKLSKTEIKVLKEISEGNFSIKEIASALKKSEKQIYITRKNLINKGITSKRKKGVDIEKKTHISLLLQIISSQNNLHSILSGSGIPILISTLKERSIKEICKKAEVKKAIAYRIINKARNKSIIIKRNSKFVLNKKLWPDLKEFLEELKKYENAIDNNIPIGSVIFHRDRKRIIFSNKAELNTSKTAFSNYEKYGIKLGLISNYYVFPKEEVNLKKTFIDSIYIAEKTKDFRKIIFVALFYMKYLKDLRNIKSNLLKKIRRVLKGEKIPNFVTLKEIMDRADVYGIKWKTPK